MTFPKLRKKCNHNQYDHEFKSLHKDYQLIKKWYGKCTMGICECSGFEVGIINLATNQISK